MNNETELDKVISDAARLLQLDVRAEAAVVLARNKEWVSEMRSMLDVLDGKTFDEIAAERAQ